MTALRWARYEKGQPEGGCGDNAEHTPVVIHWCRAEWLCVDGVDLLAACCRDNTSWMASWTGQHGKHREMPRNRATRSDMIRCLPEMPRDARIVQYRQGAETSSLRSGVRGASSMPLGAGLRMELCIAMRVHGLVQRSMAFAHNWPVQIRERHTRGCNSRAEEWHSVLSSKPSLARSRMCTGVEGSPMRLTSYVGLSKSSSYVVVSLDTVLMSFVVSCREKRARAVAMRQQC